MFSSAITLKGDPVPYVPSMSSRAVAFLSRSEVKATGIAVAFAAAAALLLAPEGRDAMTMAAEAAARVLAFNVIEIALFRVVENINIRDAFRQAKLIETSPGMSGGRSPWENSAKRLEEFYTRCFRCSALFIVAGAGIGAMSGAMNALTNSLLFTALATRAISGSRRWNMVLTNKWRIHDETTPRAPEHRHTSVGNDHIMACVAS